MNFSELFKQTGQLCEFSTDGKHLANAVQYRLIVRDVQTLQISHLFTCLDAIQYLEWSADSQFILCGMYKRGLVQVWSLEQPEWTCKVDEGSAGLSQVHFSPDSRHILTTADFHLRITVWSLLNKSVSYIKHPKACQKGFDFSTGGAYLALAERRDCSDHISIFACDSWQLVKHFQADTEDLAGVSWSPNAHVLAVWESSLQYKVLLYSLDGRCVAQYKAYDWALGIKSLAWSPSSQFLAIGSYDEKVRLLNHLTWKTIVEHSHPATMDCTAVVVYKESVGKPRYLPESTTVAQSKYEVAEGVAQVPVVKPEKNKANPKMGVGALAFSADSRYLYTINDNMPTALWIWDEQRLTQVVLMLQDAAIRQIEWDPVACRLAFTTGTNRIYMWSPAGCLSVEVPNEATFTVQSLRWHPSGNILLLVGRDRMCVCFLAEPESTAEL